MSRRERDEAALEAEIARLPDLGHEDLRKRWKLLFGRPAPKSLRRKFMARAVAYQMQVAAYGGLSAATKRRLREIAMAVHNGDRTGVFSGVQIKPGTQLIRQWQKPNRSRATSTSISERTAALASASSILPSV